MMELMWKKDELIKKYENKIPNKKQYPYICQIGNYGVLRKI